MICQWLQSWAEDVLTSKFVLWPFVVSTSGHYVQSEDPGGSALKRTPYSVTERKPHCCVVVGHSTINKSENLKRLQAIRLTFCKSAETCWIINCSFWFCPSKSPIFLSASSLSSSSCSLHTSIFSRHTLSVTKNNLNHPWVWLWV